MTIDQLIEQVKSAPDAVEFKSVIKTIEQNYQFTPTAFSNGSVENTADTNQGSCKIFAFAKLNGLTQEQTLPLFGQFYFNDVLKHPEAENHANIREFMKTGLNGVNFQGTPLTKN